MKDQWLGLDVGGANIKYSLPDGRPGSVPFELWKSPEKLASAIAGIPDWKSASKIAVTMTGELADCFESKSAGVRHICESILEVAETDNVQFYQTTGQFVRVPEAIRDWKRTAAANWHALASSIGRTFIDCIVIDIGSTTTDVIPVRRGRPAAVGQTDFERIKNNELVYTGTVRSPICAVLDCFLLNGIHLPVAQEVFATMLDAWLVLQKIPEDDSRRQTADGRPAQREWAFSRLARMLCCDRSEISDELLLEFAGQAATRQRASIGRAIESVARRFETEPGYVCVGEGKWLAREILETKKATVHQHTDHYNTAQAVADLAHQFFNSQ